jgi:tRNA A-37 threonylcarbamoyl transferase component Bud32
MNKPGALLASGRDADIFEYGDALVLRRSREHRSMVEEARVMAYVRELGYPVPAIHEVSDDGMEMVMERIIGPSMLELVSKDPSTLIDQAVSLRTLHQRLHELEAPPWLRAAPFATEGNSLLHLDLHPINVMISSDGPIVIDWARPARGNAHADVALTWLLLSSGEVGGTQEEVELVSLGRALFVEAFLEGFEREELAAQLPAVVQWKVADPHMSSVEKSAMEKLLSDNQ